MWDFGLVSHKQWGGGHRLLASCAELIHEAIESLFVLAHLESGHFREGRNSWNKSAHGPNFPDGETETLAGATAWPRWRQAAGFSFLGFFFFPSLLLLRSISSLKKFFGECSAAVRITTNWTLVKWTLVVLLERPAVCDGALCGMQESSGPGYHSTFLLHSLLNHL